VIPRRRLAPFLLLGLLTVGAGLGVGLGLSKGPVTYTATASAWGPCATSPDHHGVTIQCGTETTALFFYFPSRASIPKGFVTCITNALAPIVPTTNVVGLTRAAKAIDSLCGYRAGNGHARHLGTFQHFFENS